MRLLLTIIILLLTCTSVYAYSVSGRICDEETGRPVGQAAVGIKKVNAVEYTDKRGHFYIKGIKRGKHTLYISHSSYGIKKISIRIKRDFFIDVTLVKKIYIPAEIKNHYIKSGPVCGQQSISAQDINDLPLRGAGDSLHLLQTLPGIGGGSMLSTVPIIRGSDPLYDRYYIDDIPVDFPYHYLASVVPLFSSISGNIIEEASVIKGTAPLSFDDNLGTVIKIKTKDADQPGFHGKITLDPIAPLLPSFYATLVPCRNFSLQFSGRRTYADLVTDFDNYNAWFQDHYLKLVYNLFDSHRFTFVSTGSYDKLLAKEYSTLNYSEIVNFKWEYLINKKFFLKSIFTSSRMEQKLENTKGGSSGNGVHLCFNPNQYTLSQRLDILSKKIKFKTGYDLTLHRGGAEGNIGLDELADTGILDKDATNAGIKFPVEGTSVSFFSEAQAEYKSITGLLGIKYKYYGPLGNSSFSARTACSVKFDRKNKVYAGFGIYHAHPDLYYYLGQLDPSFKDCRSYNSSIGIKSHLPFSLSAQAEAYCSVYRDLPSPVIDLVNNPKYKTITQIHPFSNEEKGITYGLELMLKWDYRYVRGWASYAICASKRDNQSLGLNDFSSDFEQTHIFKITSAGKLGKWTPSVVFNLYSSLPYTPVISSTPSGSGNTPEYGSYNSARYDMHFRIDFKFSYLTDNGTRFYAEIWNLLYNQDNCLYPDFDKSKPYGDDNPESTKDLLPVFLWIGMEKCF